VKRNKTMSKNWSSTSAGPGPVNGPGVAGGVGRVGRVVKTAWAALMTGSRTIPFGDNGDLFRDLAAQIAASRRRR
jgi:hypothetical protein